jgi:hypothetical protein
MKVLISSLGRANIYELHWALPYHALNSEFANFETPYIILYKSIFWMEFEEYLYSNLGPLLFIPFFNGCQLFQL